MATANDWQNYMKVIEPLNTQGFANNLRLGIAAGEANAKDRLLARQLEDKQRAEDAALAGSIHGTPRASMAPPGTSSPAASAGAGDPNLTQQALARGIDVRAPVTLEDLVIKNQNFAPTYFDGTPLEGTTADVATVRQYLTNPRNVNTLPEMSREDLERTLSEYGDYRGDLLSELGQNQAARQADVLRGLRAADVSQQATALSLDPRLKGATPELLRQLAGAELDQEAVSPLLERASDERQTAMSSAAGRRQQRRLDKQYQNAVNIRSDELVGPLMEGGMSAKDARAAATRRASGELSPVYVDAEYKKSLQEGKGRSSESDRGGYATRVNSVREMLESLPASKNFSASAKDQLAVAAANDEVLYRSLTTKGATMAATDLVVIDALKDQLAGLVKRESQYSPEEEKVNKWATSKGLTYDNQSGEWIATQDIPELVFAEGSPQRGDFFSTEDLIAIKAAQAAPARTAK
tara:strand:+ start:18523 stop:19920 length:1398 start_codon:yes stop_codon:yes gene_type:complete